MILVALIAGLAFGCDDGNDGGGGDTDAVPVDGMIDGAGGAEPDVAEPDAAIDAAPDAIIDAAPDAEVDAIIDAEVDAIVDAEVDAIVDAAVDAIIDAEVDAIIDAEVDAIVDAEPLDQGPALCDSDDACEIGEICRDSICVPAPQCVVDFDCAEGRLCLGGICVPAPICDGDNPCPEERPCVEARCGQSSCVDDGQCGDGSLCLDDRCVTADCRDAGDCGAGERCIRNTCVAGECLDDIDCGDGELCIDDDCAPGDCRVDEQCEAGSLCLENVCTPADCRDDVDCGDGALCIENACVAGDCRADGDCGAGALCIDNACTPGDCRGDGECEPGQLCLDNACTLADCRDDFQCPPGALCIDNRCAEADCRGDLECGESESCVRNTCIVGDCLDETDCAAEQSCIRNQCVDGDCIEDGDCAAGRLCLDSTCTVADCRADGDCADGSLCFDNTCTEADCRVDGDCGDGGACIRNTCVDGDCLADGDCGDGELCFDNTCTEADCRVAGDCADGESCVRNTCVDGDCLDDTDCEDGVLCLANTCTPGGCRGDDDCGLRELCFDARCEAADCRVDDDCVVGQLCLERACVPGDCRVDGDCGEGELCFDNACTEADCREDADCPGDEACLRNQCIDGDCIDDGDCGGGEICLSNTCEVGNCRADDECLDGQLCLDNACTEADCRGDDDCADGSLCLSNTCTEADCREAGDCAQGELCAENRCVPDPALETCRTAEPFPVDGVIRGDLRGAPALQAGSCGGDGAERVYVKAFADEPVSCLRVVDADGPLTLHARAECGDVASEAACADRPPVGTGLTLDAAEGTTWFIFVDAPAGGEGRFTLATSVGACPPPCANDAACEAGQLCLDGLCGPAPACLDDDGCPEGRVCIAGRCAPPQCEADGDCGAGELCIDRQCVPGDCREDGDCDVGLCFDNTCQADRCRADGDCPAGICEDTQCVADGCRDDAGCAEGICLDARCVVDGCRDDEQCADGICLNNRCVDACREDVECEPGICVDNACVADGCRDDGECASGSLCIDLRCVEGACREDAQCAPGSICLDQVCVEGACREDIQCNSGERCINNACVLGGCLDDAQCVSGELCLDGVCAPGDCRADRDCGFGVCIDNNCAPPECDGFEILCPPGQICDAFRCVDFEPEFGICEAPLELPLGQSVDGSLLGAPSETSGFCGGDGPESVYIFEPPFPGPYCILIEQADFDTTLSARFQCDEPESEIECNDDGEVAGGLLSDMTVFFDFEGGEVMFIYVEDLDGEGEGEGGGGQFTVRADFGPCGEPLFCEGPFDCPPGFACLDGICGPGGEFCEVDEECDRGQLCIEGQCLEFPCEVDEDCDEGQVCDDGICFEPECVDAEGCGPGEVCIDNQCFVPPCEVDADCAEGQVCGNGRCFLPECVEDADCVGDEGDEELICDNFRCRPDVPIGTCEAPLPVVDGVRVLGTTVFSPSVIEASCASGARSPEQVHLFVPQRTSPYCATTEGSEYDTALYARTTCLDEESEFICNDDFEGVESAFSFDAEAGVPVFLFVDGFSSGNSGEYALTVTRGNCGEPPPCDFDADCLDGELCVESICVPDPCAEPEILELGQPTLGDTNQGLALNTPSCGLGASAELVYQFSTDEAGPVCITTVESSIDTVLSVRVGICDDPVAEVACNDDDDTIGSRQSRITLDAEAGLAYFVMVEGFGDQQGPISVQVDAGACPDIVECRVDGDCEGEARCVDKACVVPVDLGACEAPSALGFETVVGNTRIDATADYGASCGGGATSSEAVHVFQLPEAQQVCVNLDGTLHDTVLHVRAGDCLSGSAEIACNDDAPGIAAGVASAVTVDAAADVPYFVFVDGFGFARGDYTLTLSPGPCRPGCEENADCGLGESCVAGGCAVACIGDADCREGEACVAGGCEPAPVQGTCEAPIVLAEPLGQHRATTNGADSVLAPVCAAGPPAPEVVFEFTADADGALCLTTEGSGFDTILSVRGAPCAEGATLSCNDDSDQQRGSPFNSAVSVVGRAGQTYYAVVDGISGRSGDVVLNISEGKCRRPSFSGIRQEMPEDEIAELGFELCWSGRYGGSEPLDPILQACNQDVLMWACRPVGQETMTLAAMGERDVILTDVGNGNVLTNHNGVDWYYSPSRSMGFVAEGTGVSRNSCDTAGNDREFRMCWHTSGNRITSGYRCGVQTLNGNNSWERLIYQRSGGL